jgi:trehalose 6-phosphate synthase/phosphatase
MRTASLCAGREGWADRALIMTLMTERLIIVSNRLPVTVRTDRGQSVVHMSVGGLATGLRAPHERSGGVWVGWPGDLGGLDSATRANVLRQLADLRTIPLELDQHEVEVFYEHISNAVLWPTFHDRIDRLPLRVEGWDVYEAVNARYADAVAEQYRRGDIVWVHDYQLLRVPALLRERLPDARIGFFLHIPFPNPEIYFALPTRDWLVEGMMGADLVGFHTRRFLGHFRAALRRLFRLEMDAAGYVPWRTRRVRLGFFPIGVDAAALATRAASPEVDAVMSELAPPLGQRLLVGIDRLDYSKGIPRRFLAVERLLATRPEWRERIRFVQVAVPSRGGVAAYQEFRNEVERLVGRINGRFGTPTWTPIHYMHRGVSADVVLGLCRAADVMLVTPLRDGMNLVSKEFAASRIDEDGVLVLSEFAGAADELTDALLVNPYDIDGTADAIHAALTMDLAERRRRMRALREQVSANDVHRWVASFLERLGEAGS